MLEESTERRCWLYKDGSTEEVGSIVVEARDLLMN